VLFAKIAVFFFVGEKMKPLVLQEYYSYFSSTTEDNDELVNEIPPETLKKIICDTSY